MVDYIFGIHSNKSTVSKLNIFHILQEKFSNIIYSTDSTRVLVTTIIETKNIVNMYIYICIYMFTINVLLEFIGEFS